MNTLLTLNTAAFAVPVLLGHDPECVPLRHGLSHGTDRAQGAAGRPRRQPRLRGLGRPAGQGRAHAPERARAAASDLQTANDFLAGKLDTFVAAVTGDVQLWGRVAMVDTLALVLDRVGKYLAPAGDAAPAEPATAAAG